MTKRVFTSEENDRLFDLYDQGLTDYDVADIFHVGRNRLRDWRLSRGIISKTNKKGLKDSSCSEIMSRLRNGESFTNISHDYQVDRTSIKRLLKRNGYSISRRRTRPKSIGGYVLTPFQESVLIGDMFGDGCLVSSGPDTAYYQSSHCPEQKSFLDWKYRAFEPLSCRIRDGRTINKRTGVVSRYVRMATWSNEYLGYWRKIFYPSGIGDKVISSFMVSYLDWIGLAVWFMGDGTRDRNNIHFSVGLRTDLVSVSKALNDKFGNIFEARKYRREWHLAVLNKEIFFQGIGSYVLPCFDYKNPFKS